MFGSLALLLQNFFETLTVTDATKQPIMGRRMNPTQAAAPSPAIIVCPTKFTITIITMPRGIEIRILLVFAAIIAVTRSPHI
jgi:hypothetical protein